MRRSRLVLFLSSLLLTAGTALTGAVSAHASQITASGGYVALGDSYSSGVGAGSYDSASGGCKRSTKAFPPLWAAANAPSSFHFTACSGARTGDVLAGQLGPLSSTTGLVTITIGGNDAGFADVMTTCVLQTDSACVSRINTAQADSLAPDARPGSQGAFAASVEPPEPTYRIAPRVFAGIALGLAFLVALFPLALVWRLAHGRWRGARRRRPLSPLERALALVDWTSRRQDGDEDRRKALEALAVVLEEQGVRPLAETARAAAWDEDPPPRGRAGELGREARRALDGGVRGRPA